MHPTLIVFNLNKLSINTTTIAITKSYLTRKSWMHGFKIFICYKFKLYKLNIYLIQYKGLCLLASLS